MPRDPKNTVARILAVDIVPMLPAIWAKHPDGCSVIKFAEAVGEEYPLVYRAVKELAEMGHLRWLQRPDLKGKIVVPVGYRVTSYNMTDKQIALFATLILMADADGVVDASMVSMAVRTASQTGTKISHAGVGVSLESMERKGYLEVLQRAKGRRTARVKVYPDGNGPKRYDEPRQPPPELPKPIVLSMPKPPPVPAAAATREECRTCKCGHSNSHAEMICRRYPPNNDGYPIVMKDDWCAEYRR